MKINDYIPAGFERDGNSAGPNGFNWSGLGEPGSTTVTTVQGPLAPGEETYVTIDLKVVAAGNEAVDYINIAEIKSFNDELNNPQTNNDVDSQPDNDPTNDAGGAVMTPSDNAILGDGSGQPGDTNPAIDEDDADPEKAPIFDLALKKYTEQTTPVKNGNQLTFKIEIINQGNIPAKNIRINDYIPAGLKLANNLTGQGNTWSGSGDPGTMVTTTYAGILQPGESIILDINMTVLPVGSEAADYINVAEIGGAQDDQGNDQSNNDKDSTPDSDPANDAGGAVMTPSDNAVDGDGTGTPGDINPATDEDDADPAKAPIFDLALTKIANDLGFIKVNDEVTFTIEITNQGNIPAKNIVINDYIPEGYERVGSSAGANGTNWTGSGAAGTTTTTTITAELAPGASTTVTIDLRIIDAGNEAVDYINIAEIKSAEDNQGNDQSNNDKDSTPDSDPGNDAGGAVMTPSDDAIDGDGSGNPGDTDPATDEDDADPSKVSIFDLALKKTTAITSPVKLGEIITFTITVYNQGNVPAQNIEINDYIPAGFVREGNSNGLNAFNWSGTGDPETTTTTTINQVIAPGEEVSVTIQLKVIAAGDEAADYINRAEIKSAKDENNDDRTNDDKDSTPDSDPANDAGGLVDSPADDAVDGNGTGTVGGSDPSTDEDDADPENVLVFDLALRKTTTSTNPVKVGNTISFAIQIFNQGNIPATEIVINDYIPAGFDLADNQKVVNGGIWSGSGQAGTTVMTTLPGTLAPGISTTITIDLVVNSAGNEAADYINIAEINSAKDDEGNDQSNNDKDSTPDNNPTNDAGGNPMTPSDDAVLGDGTGSPGDTDATTDEDDADPAKVSVFDLALKKETNFTGVARVGEGVLFTITVINQGNLPASQIEIVDYIPEGYELTANPINSIWSGTTGNVTTTINQVLNPGEETTVQIMIALTSSYASCEMINMAEIKSARDETGTIDRTNDDRDSRADMVMDNDAGGQWGSPADNYVDGDGTGQVGDGVAETDEDDKDSERVEVCDDVVPVLTGIPMDQTLECDETIPTPPVIYREITATDLCDENVVIELNETSTKGTDPNQCDFYNYQITREWTATDDCGNVKTETQIITIEDTTPPDIISPPDTLMVECDGNGNLAELEAWQNARPGAEAVDNCSGITWTYGNFRQDDFLFECGGTGWAYVTFYATDVCGNVDSTLGVFKIVDTTKPVITKRCEDLTVECDGSGNTDQLQAWLDSHGGAEGYDVCSPFEWQNNFAGMEEGCGATGSKRVIFKIIDECGNEDTCSAMLTIIDTTDPEVTCDPDDLVHECTGFDNNKTTADAWDQANIDKLIDCSSDICGAIEVTSDYDFANLSDECGYTGELLVTYTIKDECDNFITKTARLTIKDESAPIPACDPDDLVHECTGFDNNKTTADAWNAANIAKLDDCATDLCSDKSEVIVTSDYDFNNLTDECGFTGTLTVIYTITDACGNDTTKTATFTVQDTTKPEVICSPDDLVHECNGEANNKGTADTWNEANLIKLRNCSSDLCGTVEVTSDYDYANLSDECGFTGSLTVTYTMTDECGNFVEKTATFTVKDETNPNVPCDPDSEIIECVGSTGNLDLAKQWDLDNIQKLKTCSYDDCSSELEVTSNFDFNNLSGDCGTTGTITVTYTVKDECGNIVQKDATLTIEDNTAPTIPCDPISETIECLGETGNGQAAADWNAANIDLLQACVQDDCGDVVVTSDFDFANLSDECGYTGGMEVTFTATDDCGNKATKTARFTIIDTANPIVACDPEDKVFECSGEAANEADADAWNAANIAKLDDCATDLCSDKSEVIVTSDYDFNNLTDECGFTGTLTVIYTITDACGNDTTKTATYTIMDTTDPELSCAPVDEVHECNGLAGNQGAADAWNAANIANLKDCATDICSENITVTSDYDYANLSDDCALTGSITVTYTITDECANTITRTATFTVQDTTKPTLNTNNDPIDLDLECVGTTDNRTIADQWNADNITRIQNGLFDNCTESNFEVTSDYNFNNLEDDCGATGSLLVTYTIKDECGNTITRTATLTIRDETNPIVTCLPDDLTIECAGLVSNEAQANNWNADNLTKLRDCASDVCGEVTVSSNYDFSNLSDGCGFTGTMTITYTITDECNNDTSFTANFTIVDTTNPQVSCDPDNETFQCIGTAENKTAADQWNDFNIAKIQSCASDICSQVVTVESDYDFSRLTDECGETGEILVTYTITDECGNDTTKTATFTIIDTEAPDISCEVIDETHECNGLEGNEAAAIAWTRAT